MTCPHCGQRFTPHHHSQRYCCGACQVAHAKAVYQRRHAEQHRAACRAWWARNRATEAV